MSQRIKLYGVTADPLRMRTATHYRYIVIVAHEQGALVKWGSSDSLATATRKLDRTMRRDCPSSVGVIVDLAQGVMVAQQTGERAAHAGSLEVLVTGSRGR